MDRRLGVFASVLVAFATLSLSACDGPQVDPPPIDTSVGSGPSRYVQVFVGSDDAEGVADPVTNGAGGSTFPAAAAPFGMVQFGPDTPWAIPPGYKYSDDQIVGDMSLFDFGTLGKFGYVPGWPGDDVYPPQPMVGQTRKVLEQYAANGGKFWEKVIADTGHSPKIEKPDEFTELLVKHLQEA